MTAIDTSLDPQPVVSTLEEFDTSSGTLAERALFNNRSWVVLFCLVVTILLGLCSWRVQLQASFEKVIPTGHPYIANYLQHKSELSGVGNAIRIAVVAPRGTIYDAEYLDNLAKLNDEVFLLSGVDRPYMKSLWTPSTRWLAVTEEGLDGGTVIPEDYSGNQTSLDQVRVNVERSGEIGQLVATDLKSSIIYVPLLDKNPDTGEPLDYGAFSSSLENLRNKYSAKGLELHITGFAKVVGDLIDGLRQMLIFFGVAVLIASAVLLAYTHCVRSTILVVACSLVAVLWQLGAVTLAGYVLDPYTVLVPFLVFAIGISHGAQKMNGIMQDIGRGTHRVVAARYTFRRLFVAGLTALLCDAVGFAVLAIIEIPVIRDLAVIASVGVATLIFTNLVLLPILLSYVGVSPKAAKRSLREEHTAASGVIEDRHKLWQGLDKFTQRPWATAAISVAIFMAVGGYAASTHLAIGDLDVGAPELRPDSRYNQDVAYLVEHYAASADVLVVMVETPHDSCTRYETLARVTELQDRLEQLPGVEGTQSMATLARFANSGYNEGSFKWLELIPNEAALGGVQTRAPRELFNQTCSLLSVYAYLKDHKAQTLESVVKVTEKFIAEQKIKEDVSNVRFLLGAGSAGIEAATNIVVREAWHQMLILVYAAVILLAFVTFRSWRAVVCAVLPLMLTSLLCEALMVGLGIGVKVATLPVIALGVGIGVDYALYVLSVMLARLRSGASLSQAYYEALLFTGKVVLLTGITLAIAVGTWLLSPIKFQADMGILLAFMFIWNMVGALVLLPALAHFLLLHPVSIQSQPQNQSKENL